MLSEFDLIARYFTRTPRDTNQIPLAVGDDCALLQPPPGDQLAVSTDMLVAGRHFFPDADPLHLGHKALAVNLSDLAAMGAAPLGFTLALSLPQVDPGWLEAFSAGLFALADEHGCPLIGGDTTKGPLNICITVFGAVPPQAALRRDRAETGDDIWVSGHLGDARLALAAMRNELLIAEHHLAHASKRLHAPIPRVALGLALRGVAHAAIDLSDGLAGDLGHVLTRSRCGATVDVDALPFGPALAAQPQAIRRTFALAGGDDYELCFTAAPSRRAEVLAASAAAGTVVTRIGKVETAPGLRLVDGQNAGYELTARSFDHFSS